MQISRISSYASTLPGYVADNLGTARKSYTHVAHVRILPPPVNSIDLEFPPARAIVCLIPRARRARHVRIRAGRDFVGGYFFNELADEGGSDVHASLIALT